MYRSIGPAIGAFFPFFPQRGLGLSGLGRFLSLSGSSASPHCISPTSFVAIGNMFFIVDAPLGIGSSLLSLVYSG